MLRIGARNGWAFGPNSHLLTYHLANRIREKKK